MLNMIFMFLWVRPLWADTPEDGAAPPEEAPATDAADTLVVTGTRTRTRLGDTPVATEVISREDLASSGADTLAEALEGRPGLQVTRSFRGAALQMGGLDPDHVLILVDGQPVVGRVGGAIDLSRFPVAEIERVEIVRGAASTLYGADAIAGVVNIITRRGEDGASADLRLAPGAFVSDGARAAAPRLPGGPGWLFDAPVNTLDASAGLGLGRGMFRSRSGVAVVASPALRAGGPATVWDSQGALTLSQRVDLAPAPDHRWTARGSGTRRQTAGTDTTATGAVVDRAQTTETWELAVGPDLVFGERGRLTVTGWWSGFRDQAAWDQRGATGLDDVQLTREDAGELDAVGVVVLPGGHALTVGAEGRHEVLTTDRLSLPTVDRQRGAVFLEDIWALGDAGRADLVAGLRVDGDTLFGQAWSPRLAVRLAPSPAFTLRANAGRGFRAPPFKDLYLAFDNAGAGYTVAGNPALRPETAWTTNLDVHAIPLGGLEWTGALRGAWLDDLIQAALVAPASAGAPARYSYVNVARARTLSAETGLRAQGRGGLHAGADLVLLHTADLDTGLPLPNRPPATVAVHTGRAPRGGWWSADLRGEWRSAAEIAVESAPGVVDRLPVPPWWNLDLRVAAHPARGVSLFAGAENLLDTGDATVNPARPRRVFAGLQVDGWSPRRSR